MQEDSKIQNWVVGQQDLKIDGFTNDHSAYEFAISGNDTEGILFQLQNDINKIKLIMPAKEYIFIFAVGINDARILVDKNRNKIPIDRFRSNLEKISQIASKYSKHIFFLGLNKVDESKTIPIPWNSNEKYLNKDIIEYNDTIKEFCKANNFRYINIKNMISKELLIDGLHPNPEGHKLIYEKVKEKLSKLLT